MTNTIIRNNVSVKINEYFNMDLFPRVQSAKWLLRLIDISYVKINTDFLKFANWCSPGLHNIVNKIANNRNLTKQYSKTLRKDMKKLVDQKGKRLCYTLNEIIEEHPYIESYVLSEIYEFLRNSSLTKCKYKKIMLETKEFFGISYDAIEICKFAFMANNYKEIHGYFEYEMGIDDYENMRLFSYMIDVDYNICKKLIKELKDMGILDEGNQIRLSDNIEEIWKDGRVDKFEEIFCLHSTPEIINLNDFNIPKESIYHLKSLCSLKTNRPRHILLYGLPGTGKSSFVHSISAHLGMKIWAVPCKGDDSTQDRRLSLVACLRLASRHKNSIILVDEAERILDTRSDILGDDATDKAWLNSFLENGSSLIIWITNRVEHLDDAIRRRFTYSIYFPELRIQERKYMLQRLINKFGLDEYLSNNDICYLAQKYKVQVAVMENAIRQTSIMRAKNDSLECIDRVLNAYTTLMNDGIPQVEHNQVKNFNKDGVCTDISIEELIIKINLIDNFIKNKSKSIQAGMGTLLFHGPSGTGKSALAKYLATLIDREYNVVRASNLLDKYVGSTEQNIAKIFSRAEQNGSVLIFDEADSFLLNRINASKSWEFTHVNEFLTSLEEFRGICICTTNVIKYMDTASIRRFSIKVPFRYAKPQQIKVLYASILEPLSMDKPISIEYGELMRQKCLTPGDFYAVKMRYWLMPKNSVSHRMLIDALIREQRLKSETLAKSMGFF